MLVANAIKIFIVVCVTTILALASATSGPGILKDVQGYDGGEAVDPVLLSNFTIDLHKTVALSIHGGQKLFFATEESKAAYVQNPRAYWLTPYDTFDHPGGMPDVKDSTMLCPSSGEEMVIGMSTPRVVHRSGQAIYFCCYGCLSKFFADPSTFFER